MYKKSFETYIHSADYQEIECDPFYQALQALLQEAVSEEVFVEVEELLHAEILAKVEVGFQKGYRKRRK